MLNIYKKCGCNSYIKMVWHEKDILIQFFSFISHSTKLLYHDFQKVGRWEEIYLQTKESLKGKLIPCIVQVPDDISGERRSEKWVQLSQNCYQPADGERMQKDNLSTSNCTARHILQSSISQFIIKSNSRFTPLCFYCPLLVSNVQRSRTVGP